MSDNEPISISAIRHPVPLPIEYQYELGLLSEECGEVVQIAGKVWRFGWQSTAPKSKVTNHELLHSEVGDVLAAIEHSVQRGLLDQTVLDARKAEKLVKLRDIAPSTHVDVSRIPAQALATASGPGVAKKAYEPSERVAGVFGALLIVAIVVGAFFVVLNGPWSSPKEKAPVAAEAGPTIPPALDPDEIAVPDNQ